MKIRSREEYHSIIGDGLYTQENCPLCAEKAGGDMLLWEGKHWFVTYNKYPYTGTKYHIMAMPNRHVKFLHELSEEEISGLMEAYQYVKEYFGEKHYFSFTRETLGNRSIEHLHMQFAEGILEGKYLRKMFSDQGLPIVQDLD